MERVAKLKGSKARKKSSKIKDMEVIPLPKTLVKTHKSDIPAMDYIYVQGIPFHQIIAKSYKFRTIEALRGKKKPNHSDVKAQPKRVINVYNIREIAVDQVDADNEFEVLIEELRPLPVNIVGAGEHIGDIERLNRTVKERTRCHIYMLP